MKSKKLLSVLLCTALLTAAFSGCGQKSSNDSSSSDSSASTGSSDAASTTGEESSTDTGEPEPLTLLFRKTAQSWKSMSCTAVRL